MKFSKYLNTVSIWNQHCIPYQKLKRKLRLYFSPNAQSPINDQRPPSSLGLSPLPTNGISSDSPSSHSSSSSTLSPLHLNIPILHNGSGSNGSVQTKVSHKEFLTLLKIEIQKVDQFIVDQEKEFYQRFLNLLSRFKAVDFSSPFSSFLYPINQSDPNHQREVNPMLSFQAAFEDVIKQLADLDEFAKINRWAIQKLLTTYTKKYMKSESRSRKGSMGESTSNKPLLPNLNGSALKNGDDSNPNSPVVLHKETTNITTTPTKQLHQNDIDKFFNEYVSTLEIGNCNNLKKITLEIEREYQFILSSGLNFINNPFINLLSDKEKELSKMITVLCQSIINNNFNLLKENILIINNLMKELNININTNLMLKEAIHSCICKTIYLGSIEMTEYLFSMYQDIVNINFRDEVDKQFIHIGAEHGHANLLEFILKRGGNIQSRDHLMRTPLHLAAAGGHVDAVRLLVDRGAKVDDSDRSKSTPLHLASRSRGVTAPTVVEILIERGASLATPAVHGRLPIHEAAAKGLVDNLKLLLIDTDIIDAQDSFGRSPLIEASRNGHKEAVQILLEAGANVDRVDEDRRTCLHEAASCGSLATLELLLSNIRDGGGKEQVSRIVNLQDDDGWTALHEATYQNWVPCAKVLLEHFANPYTPDKGEWSPIVHSLYRGNIQSSLAIIDYLKANPSTVFEQQSSVPSTPKGLKDSNGQLFKDEKVTSVEPPAQDLAGGETKSPKTPSVLSKSGAINLSSSLLSILKDKEIEQQQQQQQQQQKATSPVTKNNKITKSMISTVIFKIISSVKSDQGYKVGIIGNRKALGKWNPLHALFLEKVETINGASGESIWVGKASVPTNVQIEYKYIICQGSRLDSWETLPENRKFTPEEENELINDGTFGSIIDPTNGEIINTLTNQTNQQTDLQESLVKEYLNNNNEKFIEKGYLVNDTQVKIRFGNILSTDPQRRILQPIKMFTANQNLQVGRVVVSLCTQQKFGSDSNLLAGTDPTQITLPISKDQTITFQTPNIQELSIVQFDLYKRGMSSVLVGRASLLAKDLLCRNSYVCTCPIMNSTLQTIGELTFFPLVVSPFHHPRISDVLSNVFWKSTLLIGHRGGGAENARAVGRYRRTHIKENTILSFVTAASLGAQYIEFDVQLSREKIPIIYHDFEVATGIGAIKLPLNRLPVAQISEIKKDQQTSKSQSPINNNNSNNSGGAATKQNANQQASQQQLKKSKSMTDLTVSEIGSGNTNISSPPFNPHMNTSSSAFSNPNVGIGIVDTMATLEQAFKSVPASTGFNIEIKYPSVEVEDMLRLNNVNRNEYVDAILNVVFDHAGSRPVIFSSFDPDICLLCSLKQPRYPVFFLSNAGLSQHSDPRCNSIAEAIRFSKSSHLLGIVTNSRILVEGTPIIGEIKMAGLMLCSWGAENNDPQQVDLQETLGVDAVIVDHVAYVSKHYNN
ncbi:hypothetical protein DFA_07167 [Cavenderia fasciculata]|uniref:Glycerophosphodiester phosphodiesterase n=1 Tax=Cavenderia fasciculata TaxID=261658 RepID=F4PVN6_CACFS|nr:uncharacterized protein DFA_07167 [Cavenderia fasciculata]EGG20050.1 hypothetical protein DFA_07167 [Cavenderia fasciculata]|eukprot:XP_004367033.1 hypothetical protein DFA_07167 [Cavenderia fasciculata]